MLVASEGLNPTNPADDDELETPEGGLDAQLSTSARPTLNPTPHPKPQALHQNTFLPVHLRVIVECSCYDHARPSLPCHGHATWGVSACVTISRLPAAFCCQAQDII